MTENSEFQINNSTQKKIEKIRQAYEKKSMNQKEKAEATRLVDEVLVELFKTSYSFLIPMSFIDSELGMLLMSVKYSYEYYYTTFDMEVLFERTKSTIYYSYKKGKINFLNKGGSYVATENEVKRLLKSKGLSQNEIERRLKIFWNVKANHQEKKIFKDKFIAEYQALLKK